MNEHKTIVVVRRDGQDEPTYGWAAMESISAGLKTATIIMVVALAYLGFRAETGLDLPETSLTTAAWVAAGMGLLGLIVEAGLRISDVRAWRRHRGAEVTS